MNNKLKLSNSQLLELQAKSKWDIPLTPIQKNEFNDLADGLYRDINNNRMNNGKRELYETADVVPTIADLEFVRELNSQLL